MKKLVTVFAACAVAGLVMAADGVPSNVVGYVKTPGENGYTVFAPMFCGCLDTPMTLGAITGDFAEWVDSLQVLDAGLVASDSYVWVDVTYSGATPVWTSDFGTDDSGVIVPRGAAVIISSTATIIGNAGEVEAKDIIIDCDPGYTVLGNPTPVPITLGDIKFTGLEEWIDSLQLLDAGLVASDSYVWVDVTYSGATPVWTSDFGTDDSGIPLDPGAGFILSSVNGSKVTFPSAL